MLVNNDSLPAFFFFFGWVIDPYDKAYTGSDILLLNDSYTFLL